MAQDLSQLQAWARQIRDAAGGGLVRALTQALARTAMVAEANAKRNATADPHVRSGRLRSSIRGSVRVIEGMPAVVLRAGDDRAVKYAAALEDGAAIRPKGRYLTIPVGPGKTAAGVSRLPPADLFVLTGRDGRKWLARRSGRGVEIWYRLHPGPINISARKYLFRAATAAASTLPDALAEAVRVVADPRGGA